MSRFGYRDTATNKEYGSRLKCAFDVYKGVFFDDIDDISDKIAGGFVGTIFSPIWFPVIYFEPFPFQKPGRIEKIEAGDSSLDG